MTDERWPCQRNPDRWFSTNRKELGRAVHQCLSHCPRLAECDETEDRPRGGVLAGVLYVVERNTDPPKPDKRTLHEIPRAECGLEPKPVVKLTESADTGACGTPKGYHRHIHRSQVPCDPCKIAKAEYQRGKYREYVARCRAFQVAS